MFGNNISISNFQRRNYKSKQKRRKKNIYMRTDVASFRDKIRSLAQDHLTKRLARTATANIRWYVR